jgi:hypothetical protein
VTFSWEDHHLSVDAGWFSVSFDEPLPESWAFRADELFHQGHGSATLQTESGSVTITLVIAKKGELHVSLRLQQPPDFQPEVRLFFNLMQTDLPQIFR